MSDGLFINKAMTNPLRMAGRIAFMMLALWLAIPAWAAGPDLLTVRYPASTEAGGLSVEAAFYLWVPPKVKRVRAVIVHQHGCGDGAEKAGETAALDAHWRALAARHDAALLAPHYQARGANCRLWCDPRNGSGAVFLRALSDLAQASGHPELAEAPWCLWGHSGGGFWASLMLERHAERIVAVFCRSGTAANAWHKKEIPEPRYPDAAFQLPIILNPGLKERGDKQFDGAWTTSERFFDLFRQRGAPIAFAPDPLASHECRNSRVLAIPLFDAALRLRLPGANSALQTVAIGKGYWGDWESGDIESARNGRADRGWLPDLVTARAFSEYVKTGARSDRTPPTSAPVITSIAREAGGVAIAWEAEADLESGLRQFAIYRDGKRLGLYPETVASKTGYAQFQPISYHDTPAPNSPPMRFLDAGAAVGSRPRYAVATINGAGLEGPRSRSRRAPKSR